MNIYLYELWQDDKPNFFDEWEWDEDIFYKIISRHVYLTRMLPDNDYEVVRERKYIDFIIKQNKIESIKVLKKKSIDYKEFL